MSKIVVAAKANSAVLRWPSLASVVPGFSCTVANMPLPCGWSGRRICNGSISARNAFWIGTGSSPVCSASVTSIATTVVAGVTVCPRSFSPV